MSASPAAAIVRPAVCIGPAVMVGIPAIRQIPFLLFIGLFLHSSVPVHRGEYTVLSESVNAFQCPLQ